MNAFDVPTLVLGAEHAVGKLDKVSPLWGWHSTIASQRRQTADTQKTDEGFWRRMRCREDKGMRVTYLTGCFRSGGQGRPYGKAGSRIRRILGE